MNWFALIKRYYDGGNWTKEQVYQTVALGKITPDQYREITGDTYVM